tara:strand:+ start:861 stop:2192 length:1332 start_codon:yes stop_codon:yes gene_type:complete
MGATIEIGYFNTFVLAGGSSEGEWHVEESRIKGGFNEKTVDFGVRAHLVDEEYTSRTRANAIIYSGIFNAKTKVNKTNQFSIGEEITKAVDIANGSIQKLYAEDTNLVILQENKVNKALIDKDAIFTAEGSPLNASSNVVIGQIVPFSGNYGISNNPESFAVFGNRKYFTDKSRGAVMRLSQDGLTPISDNGMRSFFRSNLLVSKEIYGMYDTQKDKYILSLQAPLNRVTSVSQNLESFEINISNNPGSYTSESTYATLAYSEKSAGWVSFYSYKPTFGFSVNNKFYTYKDQNLYEHYRKDVKRCSFYNSSPDPASVKFVFNDQSNVVKTFLTLSYEGSANWKMISATTDSGDLAWPIIPSGSNVSSVFMPVNFIKKENKYYGHLRNNTTINTSEQVTGLNLAGIKGYFTEIKMEYWQPEDLNANQTKKAEIFAVSSDAVYSS